MVRTTKKVIILIFAVLISTATFAERIPNQFGADWRTDKPIGKYWIKVTDIHYLDKSSVKKVKGRNGASIPIPAL